MCRVERLLSGILQPPCPSCGSCIAILRLSALLFSNYFNAVSIFHSCGEQLQVLGFHDDW